MPVANSKKSKSTKKVGKKTATAKVTKIASKKAAPKKKVIKSAAKKVNSKAVAKKAVAKKTTVTTTVTKSVRSFKVRLPGSDSFEGRFTGLTPYQAANKALSSYYRTNLTAKQKGAKITFTIKESTRGSKKNEYTYNGKREKLATPVTYPIEQPNGEVRMITKAFKNRLTKVKKAELAKLLEKSK